MATAFFLIEIPEPLQLCLRRRVTGTHDVSHRREPELLFGPVVIPWRFE